MKLKVKQLLSLLLAFVLLTPTVVKLEHHHEHFICRALHEKHFHQHHPHCYICSFEYSLVSLDKPVPSIPPANAISGYINSYITCFSHPLPYSFLLRAPPVVA